MTPEEQVRRAQRADALLNDDLFKDAIKKLRDDAMDAFKSAKTTDDFLKARALYDTTETFANVFINVIRGGEFAARRIEDAKALKKPPKHIGPTHAFR
jgi:hypothetical protein